MENKAFGVQPFAVSTDSQSFRGERLIGCGKPLCAGAVNYAVFELLEAEEQGERSFAAFEPTSS
jgi:hypothetical protein